MKNKKLLSLVAAIFCLMMFNQSLWAATGELKNMFPPGIKVSDDTFIMAVEYSLSDESTWDALAVGPSTYARLSEGDELEAVGINEKPLRVTVQRVERTEGGIGLTLRGIEKSDIRRGMVIAKPGVISAHKVFKAKIQLFNKEEGGLNKPIHNGSIVTLSLWGTDVTGEIILQDAREMVMPGDNTTVTVMLDKLIALDKKLQFKIREGGKTIGAGTIKEVVK